MKSSRRQFLVSFTSKDTAVNITGYFVTKTGGDKSVPVTKAYDGGAKHPDLVPGIEDTSNVVVGRHFDVARDNPIIKACRGRVGTLYGSLTVQPTDADLVPQGDPTSYATALLTRIGEPTPDAGAGDPSTFELEFAVTDVI